MLSRKTGALLAMLMLLSGCASTRIVSSWREPSFKGPIAFKKILVLAVHPFEAIRRAAEDELVFQIGGGRAVPAYQVVSEEDRKDVEKLKAKIQAGGFDGVIAMRVISKKSDTAWVSNAMPEDPYDSYDRGIQLVPESGYARAEMTYTIKTNIYTVADAKLIWSGITDTVDPSQVEKVVRDVAKAVGEELRKQKLLV